MVINILKFCPFSIFIYFWSPFQIEQHNNDMNKLLYLVIICLLAHIGVASCGHKPSKSEPYLLSLDSTLDKASEYEIQKKRSTLDLTHRYQRATNPIDRYFYASQLADEYTIFRIDSAMKYIDICMSLANQTENRSWRFASLIRKTDMLTGTGLLQNAEETMLSIDTTGLSRDEMIQYYGMMIFLYSHLGSYRGGDSNMYYTMERSYKDSIMRIIPKGHPEYLWFRSWDVLGSDTKDSTLIPALVDKIDKSDKNSRQDAKEAYILSKLYEEAGDSLNALKYMVLAAEVDIAIDNAEIASMEELANMLYEAGDVNRAYRYINYSINKSISYPNRVRALSEMRVLDKISKVYQERIRRQNHLTETALIIASLLALILLIAAAWIVRQNRRLRNRNEHLAEVSADLARNNIELSEAKKHIEVSNNELNRLNYDLKRKNEQLNEANYVKEEYIGSVFTICSNYIKRMEEFRRTVYAKAKNKQYTDIIRATEGNDTTKQELKKLFNSFDSVFLHIYPDFVADFNTLLQDDQHVTPKEGELLNTELRIYALVRLGIADSVKIAEFLHCSPQTVYNYRYNMRNRAKVDKKDFAERVHTLGQFIREDA